MFRSEPPPPRPFSEAKPTLLVSWWVTLFCTCIILLRLAGRYIRVERLFREDKIAALALVPLFARMACVHIVLLWGTNNIHLNGARLSDSELSHRESGSRAVLACRIFHGAALWALKLATLEFLTRLAGASMKKLYLRLVVLMRYALGVSLLAVIITGLAACRPVAGYWQVAPDPGGQCRQGFEQLIAMGAASAAIDVVLIVFPVPIVLSTRISGRRKFLLVMLFGFGFLTVGITLFRVPRVIQRQGDQVFRSMWASVELLAATAVANIVALGSFLRDSGAKKTKFRPGYHGSGTTSRGGGVTTGAAWNDLEQAKSLQLQLPRKTESDEWLDQMASSRTRRESIRKVKRHSSHSSGGNRGLSPTTSHDSLIRREYSFSRGTTSVLEMPAPKILPLPKAFVASSGGF